MLLPACIISNGSGNSGDDDGAFRSNDTVDDNDNDFAAGMAGRDNDDYDHDIMTVLPPAGLVMVVMMMMMIMTLLLEI